MSGGMCVMSRGCGVQGVWGVHGRCGVQGEWCGVQGGCDLGGVEGGNCLHPP